MKKALVLKASAGTGKTYRLSLEFIYSLSTGTDFKDILVMTFTKKATSEIKERILKFLKNICESPLEKEEIEKNISDIYKINFKFDSLKIRKLYNHINENKDKLKIYTIDSFTNTIFKKAIAPYLKIYSYEIIDEEENKKILIKTFQKLFENKEVFLLFKDFLEDNSEKNMDKYIGLIKKIIDQRWKLLLLDNPLLEKEKFSVKASREFIDKMESILKEIAIIKKKSDVTELIKKDFLEYFKTSNKDKFLTDNYQIFLKDKLWNGNKVRVKQGDIETHLEDLNYLDREFKNNFGKEMYNLLVIPYETKLLKVIKKIYDIYDEIKFREKRFTFTDLSIYTYKYIIDEELNFIDKDGLTDEFFEVIDGRFKNIFIDEFQDTSILQWKILKNIIDKSERTICVGDEKQSIYGWRGGEKRLFENLHTIIGGEIEELDKCFRSKKNIVETTNNIFSKISTSTLENPQKYWNFKSVKFKSDSDDGYIKVLESSSDIESVDKMVEEIKNNFTNNYSEIGILARNKKTLERIGEILGENSIPYTLESDADIIQSKEIFGIYSLIVWLVKGDFLSLLDFLRSELIGFTAPELKYIITNKDKVKDFIFRNGDTLNTNMTVLHFLKKIVQEFENSHGKTYSLTYELILELGVAQKFSNDENISTIFEFFKLLKSYEYFSDFLSEYEENSKKDKFKKITRDNSDGISLMTIHKSKGLEFNTLFYYLPSKSRSRADNGMEFHLKMDNTYSKVISYLVTDNKFNKILENIDEITYLEDEKLKNEHEEINNLYVALTRAKNNLYMVVENSEELKNSYLNVILENKEQGVLILSDKKVKILEDMMDYSLTLASPELQYKKNLDENKKEALDKIYSHTLQLESKRIKGTIIHYFLENILNWSKEEIQLAKKLTFNKYSSTLGESEIKTILSDKNIEYIYSKCKTIFSENWDFIYREYPVYPKIDGEIKTLRLDRLMIKLPKDSCKGIIYIADYKTGKHDDEQMENYKLAILQMLEKSGEDIANYEIKTEFIIL